MGESESALPPSKKRAAGREISRDNPGLDDEGDSGELETGTFKRASDEVLAGRRMVKVRRGQNPSAPSSNPFAGIRLVAPIESSANSAESKEHTAESKETVAESKEIPVESKETRAESKELPAESKETQVDVSTEILPSSEKAVSKDASNETQGDEGEKAVPENVQEHAVGEAGKGEDEKISPSETDKESVDVKENIDKIEKSPEPVVDGEKQVKCDEIENADKKDNDIDNAEQNVDGAPLSSFQQLSSSQNAFTGLAGTGFSSSTFSFGSISKDGSAMGTTTGSLFGLKNEQPSFSFGLSNNGNSSLFSAAGASVGSKSEGSGFPSMSEVTVETGEEKERVAFSADSVLFEYLNGGWKERGKGEIKVNVATTGSKKARLLMRAKGNYRLILNANIFPEMKLTNMEKRGITFACVNSTSEGKGSLSTFALKLKDASIVEEFRVTVEAHKVGTTAADLKTPENSPKGSDD